VERCCWVEVESARVAVACSLACLTVGRSVFRLDGCTKRPSPEHAALGMLHRNRPACLQYPCRIGFLARTQTAATDLRRNNNNNDNNSSHCRCMYFCFSLSLHTHTPNAMVVRACRCAHLPVWQRRLPQQSDGSSSSSQVVVCVGVGLGRYNIHVAGDGQTGRTPPSSCAHDLLACRSPDDTRSPPAAITRTTPYCAQNTHTHTHTSRCRALLLSTQ
jgi:hypothetical protein